MPDGEDSITLATIAGAARVARADWDACAGDADPFLSHDFFLALEESGSAGSQTGWAPCHLVARDRRGTVLAIAPLYAKSHSYGEYVFDWGWADAWHRAGGRYYPKLQAAVPFTPVGGQRFLVRPGQDRNALTLLLAEAIAELAERSGLSSAHVTFCSEDEAALLAGQGWLPRIGEQYHWPNRGFSSFEDFLATLSSRKRKAIRKERERAAGLGLRLLTLSGDDIKPRHWDAFHRFYEDTTDRKFGQAYLTRDFFHRLGQSLGERIALMVAEEDGRMVAGALNLIGTQALYGRNWGQAGDYPFLHFELCYYRAIDFAIERGLSRVEAGAQGEHKIQRGYLPVATHSAHWIADAGFRKAVADFLRQERMAVEQGIEAGREMGPYRCEE